MATEGLYKDAAPAAGDVHVPATDWLDAYTPARSPKDIEDEAAASRRADGKTQGNIALKEDAGYSAFFKVSGVDEELGIVFGWGLVCTENGQDYYDVQKNHVPEPAMVHATTEFMKDSRMAGEQHTRMEAGAIVHSFPLTREIWKAMFSGPDGEMMGNLPPAPPKSGWMVACAPDAGMLKRFKSGELTGFSIGGAYVEIDGRPVAELQRAA